MSIENRLYHLEEQYTELLSKMSDLRSCVNELMKNRDILYNEIKQAEIKINRLDQHKRSRSIEICNIPESVKADQLRAYIIELCQDINVNIDEWSIAKVYRARNRSSDKPSNVVVCFVDPRFAFMTRKNRRLLATVKDQRYKKLFIIENLCPLNKRIFNRLYKLQKQGSIYKVWTYDRKVYMKIEERGERIEVSHPNNIDNLIYPASPPLFNKSQTYSNDENSQEVLTATDDKLPQNAKQSNRDMTVVETEADTSRHHSEPITSTRQKSKQEIRRALEALYSEAIGTDN